MLATKSRPDVERSSDGAVQERLRGADAYATLRADGMARSDGLHEGGGSRWLRRGVWAGVVAASVAGASSCQAYDHLAYRLLVEGGAPLDDESTAPVDAAEDAPIDAPQPDTAPVPDATTDAGPDVTDATDVALDAARDVAMDAPLDVAADAPPADVAMDAGVDARPDAAMDVPHPTDAAVDAPFDDASCNVAGNEVRNAGFESGTSNWFVYAGVPDSGTVTVNTSMPHSGSWSTEAVVPAASAHTYDLQWIQVGLSIAAGTTYRVSYWVRSTAPVPVLVELQGDTAPYPTYCMNRATTTTGWTQVVFTCPIATTNPDIQIFFGLAGGAATTWIDDVAVVSCP